MESKTESRRTIRSYCLYDFETKILIFRKVVAKDIATFLKIESKKVSTYADKKTWIQNRYLIFESKVANMNTFVFQNFPKKVVQEENDFIFNALKVSEEYIYILDSDGNILHKCCNYEEAAKTLGIPINTVRTRLHRSLQNKTKICRSNDYQKVLPLYAKKSKKKIKEKVVMYNGYCLLKALNKDSNKYEFLVIDNGNILGKGQNLSYAKYFVDKLTVHKFKQNEIR